ncbi:RlpA-like double-psi beta-barrel domain-containing protein [Lentzea sp. NPDC006480]|uniref:RlpA-like double-psi beta-barrel domain-containing protein n=1 Tax=Lentzea sp. NPDC006480 TaxID=3157176 RepID=UPI0033A1A29C
MTFYVPSLGACGQVSLPTDYVASLPASMFDPSPGGNPNNNKNCGRKIKVTRGANSVVVTVVDRCSGCKRGDLEISPTAFQQLAPLTAGRILATWVFVR